MTRGRNEVAQGVAAFVGITLGLIPLGQAMIEGAAGSLWRLVPGIETVPPVTGPLVLLLAAVLVIAVLERRQH